MKKKYSHAVSNDNVDYDVMTLIQCIVTPIVRESCMYDYILMSLAAWVTAIATTWA